MRRLQGAEHILARTNARIDEAAFAQFLEGGPIESLALALGIRRVGASAIRALPPRETEPAQILEHGRNELRLAAASVKILISQDQTARGGESALLREPKGARVAQV